MNSENLTAEQEQFLEECEDEFIDRYTESDEEYQKIYDLGIPPPPIMFPWYGRARYNDRPGSSRNESFQSRNRYQDGDNFQSRNRFQENDGFHSRNRFQEHGHYERNRHRNHRHRPY